MGKILFLSHFDKDHVNCITELFKEVRVMKILIPSIPEKFCYVYDRSNGVYYSILNFPTIANPTTN